MTIKDQYKKEWSNYLRRVNRAVKQGYIVEPIKKVKKPTQASIRRLKSLTGEKIRKKSEIVDIETGEILKPIKDKKKRRQQQKKNVLILNKPLQEVSDTVIYSQPTASSVMSTDILSMRDSYEQIIEQWYSNVEQNFYWYIASFIISQTNRLIEGKPDEVRKKFAYVYTQNPDIFPEPPYETREAVMASFNDIAHMMDLAEDSESYKDFLSMYDFVEREE